MKKLNNRGMSLIELIVAIAILGLVSTSIMNMLVSSTKSYTKYTGNTKVSYLSQFTLARMEQDIMNCNRAISWDDDNDTLIVQTTDAMQIYCLKDGSLYYASTLTLDEELEFDDMFNRDPSGKVWLELSLDLLAENVDEFDVELKENQVDFDLEITKGDSTTNHTKSVALRNDIREKNIEKRFWGNNKIELNWNHISN